MRRRTFITGAGGTAFAIAAGVPALASGGPPAAGPPADVVVPAEYTTIQAAVDAADPGDTVLVDGGTYREQVLVDKDLTLKGTDGATIEAEDGLNTYTIVESGSTWAPMLFAYGGTLAGGAVAGSETVDVTVTGLHFDGRGNTGQPGRKTGILYRNVRGSGPEISHNTVTDMGTPGGSISVVAYGDTAARIKSNEVVGFGRGGIGANGDGGAHPSPTVAVRDNVVDSRSATGGSAPNGVQIGFGAGGHVQGNTVKNCRYATDTTGLFQSSGILVFESDGVRVVGNTLKNNDVAAAVSAWGWFRGSADNCKVVRNDVSDALIGVNLRATAWDQDGSLALFTEQDPSVSNCKVINNDIADSAGGPTGEAGIAVESNDRGDSDQYEPIASNNKVIRNAITGFPEQVSDDGSDTKVKAIAP